MLHDLVWSRDLANPAALRGNKLPFIMQNLSGSSNLQTGLWVGRRLSFPPFKEKRIKQLEYDQNLFAQSAWPQSQRFKFCGLRKSFSEWSHWFNKSSVETQQLAQANPSGSIVLILDNKYRLNSVPQGSFSPSQDGEINDFTHHLISFSSCYTGTLLPPLSLDYFTDE